VQVCIECSGLPHTLSVTTVHCTDVQNFYIMLRLCFMFTSVKATGNTSMTETGHD
jgi:hypothetical protein